MSKAASIDRLSGCFLRDGAEVLSRPISDMCNLSISRGLFSDACKVAKLKSIYKIGKKTKPSNDIPISFLPIISKMIERIPYDQTKKSLSENNILYNFHLDLDQITQKKPVFDTFNRKDIKRI